MASDAHAHPYDLMQLDSDAEKKRCALGIRCAASSWKREEFLFQEELSEAAGMAVPMALCFGVHPQLLAGKGEKEARRSLETLDELAREGRLKAIGEAGFDLFDNSFRATEAQQEELFCAQIELARAYNLPLVLHLRRAMHKAFKYSKQLKRLSAVAFHSYSGTRREGEDFLKRGVNAYFSFGTTIALNHKTAQEAVAYCATDRLLFETDAPYQALRGKNHSTWSDIHTVLEEAVKLRKQEGTMRPSQGFIELDYASDLNFSRFFGYAEEKL